MVKCCSNCKKTGHYKPKCTEPIVPLVTGSPVTRDDKLRAITGEYRDCKYMSLITKTIEPINAMRNNSQGCISKFVKENSFFLRHVSCTHDEFVPFASLGSLTCRCLEKGTKIINNIKGSMGQIYIRCSHSERVSADSKCLAHDTGFVSLKNCDVDHIVPIGAGGLHHISNMQFICASCNRSKGINFSVFDSFKLDLFHPRYRAEIKTFLEGQRLIGNIDGTFKLDLAPLANLTDFAVGLVNRFTTNARYNDLMYDYVKEFHPIVFKNYSL